MTIKEDIAQDEIRQRLEGLKSEHRDLDDAISALLERGALNHLQVQRMKKRKLVLRDQIAVFENMLLPDIIA